VPVGYLVLNSEIKTVGEIQDQALFKVRPMFASIPGVSAPPPFGGNARTVVVRADPDRLRAYNISPDEVVRSLTTGNTISPSGSIRTPTSMPLVPSNAMVVEPKDLGNISIRPGVFLRDVAPSIQDSTDIPTGYALVNQVKGFAPQRRLQAVGNMPFDFFTRMNRALADVGIKAHGALNHFTLCYAELNLTVYQRGGCQ
jgi:multidrug efflux pump subunit AcrB